MRSEDATSSAGVSGNGTSGTSGSNGGGSPATLESEAAPEGDYSAAPAEAAPPKIVSGPSAWRTIRKAGG